MADPLDLDWERLRAGDVRALNPGYQDVFDAYATLRAERDEARKQLVDLTDAMESYREMVERLRSLLREVCEEQNEVPPELIDRVLVALGER